MTRWWTTIFALGVLAGCAGGPVEWGTVAGSGEEVRRAPVAVAGRATSSLPEPYYVLSGPAETYRAHRVVERFAGIFAYYVARKSGPGKPGIEVVVNLDALVTGYREVGGMMPAGGVRRAGRAEAEGVQVAAAGRLAGWGPLGRFGDFARDRGGLSIPYEITKRATLTATVEVSSAGRRFARETVKAEAEEVIRWEDYDPWAYDYATVLYAALGKALGEVDRVVDAALATGDR